MNFKGKLTGWDDQLHRRQPATISPSKNQIFQGRRHLNSRRDTLKSTSLPRQTSRITSALLSSQFQSAYHFNHSVRDFLTRKRFVSCSLYTCMNETMDQSIQRDSQAKKGYQLGGLMSCNSENANLAASHTPAVRITQFQKTLRMKEKMRRKNRSATSHTKRPVAQPYLSLTNTIRFNTSQPMTIGNWHPKDNK